MTKILLVEDDKSLREIYGVRLLAEGYDIVSAGDGEEALAMAIKERPRLILSDVMMPKISGFDMLDILRMGTIYTDRLSTTNRIIGLRFGGWRSRNWQLNCADFMFLASQKTRN
jgi:DNA-binding response OmpR family regulator